MDEIFGVFEIAVMKVGKVQGHTVSVKKNLEVRNGVVNQVRLRLVSEVPIMRVLQKFVEFLNSNFVVRIRTEIHFRVQGDCSESGSAFSKILVLRTCNYL